MTEPSEARFPYRSAYAFGAALTDRFKILAAESQYSISQLRRQFSYDRLLARVFSDTDEGWILKGGVGMLARLSIARHSADVDLVARADSPARALDALRSLAATDLADFFSFRFESPRNLVQGVEGIRIRTEA